MNACDEVYENDDKQILTESKSWLQNTAGSQNDIEKINDDNDKWDLNYKVGLASSILTNGQKISDTTSNHKIIVEEDKKEAKEFISNIKFSTKTLKDIASSYNKFKYEISDDKFVIQIQPKRQISFKESRRIVNNQITRSQKNLLAMFSMNDRTLYNVVNKKIFWIVKSVQNWMRTYEDNENPQRAYESKKTEYYEWKLNRENMKASKIVKNDGLSEIKDKQELLKEQNHC